MNGVGMVEKSGSKSGEAASAGANGIKGKDLVREEN